GQRPAPFFRGRPALSRAIQSLTFARRPEMKIALEWLRQMVRIETDAASVANQLTMGGLEVEDLAPVTGFSQVVVARVVRVERHPNADRLCVCQVDTGENSLRTIVCGAPNVAVGLLVPCALPGAMLPGEFV